jgi:hypothetical protein
VADAVGPDPDSVSLEPDVPWLVSCATTVGAVDAVVGSDDAVSGPDDAVSGPDDAVSGPDDAVSDPDEPEPGADASVSGVMGAAVSLVTSVEASGVGAGSLVGGVSVGDGCSWLVVGGDATSLVGPVSVGGVGSPVGTVSSSVRATSFAEAEAESVVEVASAED